MADDDPTRPHEIELTLPLAPRYASTLRTVAASIGADVGFSIDELEDLRLALSEVVAAFSSTDQRPARLLTTFSFSEEALAVTMRTDDARACDFDELSTSVMRAVTDAFTVADTFVSFEKRPVESFET